MHSGTTRTKENLKIYFSAFNYFSFSNKSAEKSFQLLHRRISEDYLCLASPWKHWFPEFQSRFICWLHCSGHCSSTRRKGVSLEMIALGGLGSIRPMDWPLRNSMKKLINKFLMWSLKITHMFFIKNCQILNKHTMIFEREITISRYLIRMIANS